MALNSFWKLKLWINHTRGQGFSESYNLAATGRSTAKLDAALILSNRALLLANNESIVHASISDTDSARDSTMPAAYLSDPMTLLGDETDDSVIEEVNRLKEGILVSYFTSDGRKTSKLFRGIRDSWCANMRLTVTPSAATPSISWVTPAAGFTDADAIGQFLSVLLYKTQHIRKLPTDPVTYDNTAYAGYTVLGIGERDCGPGYSFSRGRARNTV